MVARVAREPASVAVMVADCCKSMHRAECEANARLIAASKDLLEAAEAVLADLDARIQADVAAGRPVPIFRGLGAMHDAVSKAKGGRS